MASIDLLKKVALFEGFTEQELTLLGQAAREKEVAQGESVFDEGAPAQSLFIIKEGTVEIVKHGESDQQIAAMGRGSHFGEMAFLDHSTRAAAAVAREPARVLELQYADLERIIGNNKDMGFKFYRTLAMSLAKRIRKTTVDLSQLKDLKLRHV